MDILIIALIAAAFGLYPILNRSNMLTVLGMLSFGWVLSDTTGAEIMQIARSTVITDSPDGARLALLTVSILPALLAAYLTKGKVKNPLKLLFGGVMVPAILVIGWLLVLSNLAFDTRVDLQKGRVHEVIEINKEYALWMGSIAAVVATYPTVRKKTDKDGKK